MAVSVTSRPNTWSAVRNPIVYKFATTGGPFVNYRIEVEVFKASDDTSLTSGIKFSFSPDADDNTYADVSEIIAAYLKAEWIKPAAINEAEADTSLGFYIKYQELYDGSAVAVVDDVANPRYAVFAGLQIPNTNGNNLTDYVPADDTKKFLNLLDRPRFIADYPFTLSIIYSSALANGYTLERHFNASGTEIGLSILSTLDSAQIDSVNRIQITTISLPDGCTYKSVQLGQKPAEPAGYTDALTVPDDDFTIGTGPGAVWFVDVDAGTSWAGSGGSVASGGSTTKTIRQALPYSLNNRFLKVEVKAQWAVTGTYQVKLFHGLGQVAISAPTVGLGVGTDIAFTFYVFSGRATNDDEIGVKIVKTAGSDSTIVLTHVAISEGAFIDFLAPLTLDLIEPCDNPVWLVWKNSLGGDSWWLFDYSQETGYNISGKKKAKRMTLFANHLTLDQWEALNELNTPGEIYQQNIRELTASVDKTAVRDGAQVYIVNSDGDKTGVIVIPSASAINTRDESHSIEIDIELPERIE